MLANKVTNGEVLEVEGTEILYENFQGLSRGEFCSLESDSSDRELRNEVEVGYQLSSINFRTLDPYALIEVDSGIFLGYYPYCRIGSSYYQVAILVDTNKDSRDSSYLKVTVLGSGISVRYTTDGSYLYKVNGIYLVKTARVYLIGLDVSASGVTKLFENVVDDEMNVCVDSGGTYIHKFYDVSGSYPENNLFNFSKGTVTSSGVTFGTDTQVQIPGLTYRSSKSLDVYLNQDAMSLDYDMVCRANHVIVGYGAANKSGLNSRQLQCVYKVLESNGSYRLLTSHWMVEDFEVYEGYPLLTESYIGGACGKLFILNGAVILVASLRWNYDPDTDAHYTESRQTVRVYTITDSTDTSFSISIAKLVDFAISSSKFDFEWGWFDEAENRALIWSEDTVYEVHQNSLEQVFTGIDLQYNMFAVASVVRDGIEVEGYLQSGARDTSTDMWIVGGRGLNTILTDSTDNVVGVVSGFVSGSVAVIKPY